MQNARYNALVAFLRTNTFPNQFSSTKSNFLREAKHYSLTTRGVLRRDNRIVARYSERRRIYKAYHAHSSRDRTWALISERYYWRGGWEYCKKRVHECIPCSQKSQNHWRAHMPSLQAIQVIPKAMWRMQ